MTNREKLRKWLLETMERHQLDDAAVAALVHGSAHRVAAWRRPETAKGSNPVPVWAVELIALKLALADISGTAMADVAVNLRQAMPKSLPFQHVGTKVEPGKTARKD